MAMIEIQHVSKWYNENFQVLKDCTANVEKGEVVVVCGPSGSGKSTLIKTVNGLEPFQEGKIVVNGIDVGNPKTNLPKLRQHIGINDRFMIIRNLFGGSSEAFDTTMAQLNTFTDLDDALLYIQDHYNWNPDDDSVKLIVDLLERKLG